jgi:hypothetical protein
MGVWEIFETQEPIPIPNTEFNYPVLHAVMHVFPCARHLFSVYVV